MINDLLLWLYFSMGALFGFGLACYALIVKDTEKENIDNEQ